MKLENVKVGYQNKVVLENLNFEIEGVTCLVGENGKGKTTILKTLAGLLEPLEGKIIDRPKVVSYCFQEDRLFKELTVLENLKLVCQDETKIDNYLNKLTLKVYKNIKVKELSGGCQRMTALLRALVFDSEIVLLDEPFNGIDEENKKVLFEIIKKETRPIVLVTHKKEEIEAVNGKVVTI